MIILGLNAYHGDAAACLVRDGRIIAAAEEERFRRVKHWAGFPAQAIRYCLEEAGISIANVDHVAVNSDPTTRLRERLAYALFHAPDPRLLIDRVRNHRRRLSIEAEIEAAFPDARFHGKVHRVEHHLAHLASAFLVSPFEEAVALSVDGFGDFASAAWGVGAHNALRIDGRINFPHSLGVFYQALTQYLGFSNYGDEYKVMGLAPYGAPRFLGEMSRILRSGADGTFALDLSFFRHHRERVAYQWDDGAPHVGPLYSSALVDLLGPPRQAGEQIDQRWRDIARSVQEAFEEALFRLLTRLHDRYKLDDLALAGGCAMNSVANGKITRRTPFRRVYVPAAAGDAGGAVGAAILLSRRFKTVCEQRAIDSAYLGPGADAQSIALALSERADEIASEGCAVRMIGGEDELCLRTARAIAEGKVVGWFQGRMEWGPRALGNRSILADPRRADMKDILNAKIKRRESFRPFAPSILSECVADWFEDDPDVPFMSQVLPIREAKRALIPAVTHVDGSGRLQTVAKDANPRYHRLISAFHSLTGAPMVLNTSFNESEPIVCRPQEALDCFLRTKMDELVLGDVAISREEGRG